MDKAADERPRLRCVRVRLLGDDHIQEAPDS